MSGTPYFEPKAHGLVDVGRVNWIVDQRNDSIREWVVTTVLYHPETDRFYWERAAGCCCNEPFDAVSGPGDMESGTLWELTSALARTLAKVAVQSYLTPKTWETVSGNVVDVLAAAAHVREYHD
jgi:hypothetical protein